VYISFIGRIHSKPKQDGDDCMIGVNIMNVTILILQIKGE